MVDCDVWSVCDFKDTLKTGFPDRKCVVRSRLEVYPFFGSREEFTEVTSSSKDYLGSCTTRVKTYALDTAIVLRTIASLFRSGIGDTVY